MSCLFPEWTYYLFCFLFGTWSGNPNIKQKGIKSKVSHINDCAIVIHCHLHLIHQKILKWHRQLWIVPNTKYQNIRKHSKRQFCLFSEKAFKTQTPEKKNTYVFVLHVSNLNSIKVKKHIPAFINVIQYIYAHVYVYQTLSSIPS